VLTTINYDGFYSVLYSSTFVIHLHLPWLQVVVREGWLWLAPSGGL